MKAIRITTTANALQSVANTDSYVFVYSIPAGSYKIVYQIYDNNCSCEHQQQTCFAQSSLYQVVKSRPPFSFSLLFRIPGFYTGCFVLESLRRSTLEFFYDQTMINQLQKHLPIPVNATALISPVWLESKYLPNTTIGELLDELFIEKWKTNTCYPSYFEQCKPLECTYTVTKRDNAIHLITAHFGLIGGTLTVLEIIVPLSVRLILRKLLPWLRQKVRRRNIVTPIS
jgi:hypothetical protein